MLGRLGMRLAHPKSLLFLYLFTVTATVIWIFTNLGVQTVLTGKLLLPAKRVAATWCPPSKQEPGYPHVVSQGEHMMRMQRTQIQQLEERLSQREKTLNQIESKLKKMHPDDFEALLRVYEDENPTIYAITPTHTRPVQKAELTRLSQTFLHVPKFHWIVVEDSAVKTDLVTNLLRTCVLSHTHLNAITPPDYKLQDEDPNWLKPRGVVQRNAALEWIRQELRPNQHKGVVYFANDDNTYSLELFEEMRNTGRVSVWPVGLVGKLRYESPILKDGKVHNFLTYWKPERPFAMDMAGFAMNLKLLFEFPDAKFKLRVKRGYLESDFLEQLARKDELEPKADNCTKVLVWHTRTEKANLKNEERLRSMGIMGSDPRIEV